MKTPARLAAIGLLAATICTPLLADEREHAPRNRHADRAESGMQAVVHAAAPGEPGYGWRYFSDPAAARAVVISPDGEYFYSHGHGLRPIAASRPGA